VLRAFPDVARYGRLLVDVAQRAGNGSSLAITGFSERAGPLVRRIRAMTHRDVSGGMDGIVCACATVAVLMILPPAPSARSLPGYTRPILLIPKGVGDSVVTVDRGDLVQRKARVVAGAHDLPAVFEADSTPEPADGLPAAGRCRQWLRDPRTGTRLQLLSSSTHTAGVVQREDTAWTRISSIGLYRVGTPGAYGVGEGQLLRVGCGAVNHRVVAGQLSQSKALSDLESPNDDRARRIGEAVRRAVGLKANAVELYSGRLNVVVTNKRWMDESPDARWATTKQVWTAARDAIGRAAMPETLAFSVQLDSPGSVTLYYYSSHPR